MFEVFRSRSASASSISLDRTNPNGPASPPRRGRSALSSRIKLGLVKHLLSSSSAFKDKAPAPPNTPSTTIAPDALKPRLPDLCEGVPGGKEAQPPKLTIDRRIRARSDSTPSPVHKRLSIVQAVATSADIPPTPRPVRPPRNPARVQTEKRPSTASGLIESSPHSEHPRRKSEAQIGNAGRVESHHRPSTSHTTKAEANLLNNSKARFSTADRTILKELQFNMSAVDSQFALKGPGRKRHHPYPSSVVPYPRNYDRAVVDLDVWEIEFTISLGKGVTFHQFDTPPARVLDIGCGSGAWIMHCAKMWKESTFVGLDLVPLQPDLHRLGSTELAQRITWVQANFLEGLPFPNEEFDFVYIRRIASGMPEDKWDSFFEEVLRVMKSGAAIEMIEEDLYFPGSINDPLVLGSTPSLASRPSSAHYKTAFSSSAVNLNEAIHSSNDSSTTLASSGSPLLASASAILKQSLSRTRSTHRSAPQSPANIQPITVDFSSRPRASSSVTPGDNIKDHDEIAAGDVATPLPSSSIFSHWNGSQTFLSLSGSGRTSESVQYDTHDTTTRNHMHKPSLSALRTSKLGYVGRQALETFSTRAPSVHSPAASALSSTAALFGSLLSHGDNQSRVKADITLDPFTKASRDLERDRTLYHPSPKPHLLENPRDHVLLETVYKEMYSARFINLSPLSLISNLLEIYFSHVRTHAPVSLSFPPADPPKVNGDVQDDESDTWSDSDNDSSYSDEGIDTQDQQRKKRYSFSSDLANGTQDHDTIRKLHRQNRRKSASIYSAQQYLFILDDARAPVRRLVTQRSSTSLKSLPHTSLASSTRTSTTLQDGQLDKDSSFYQAHVLQQREKMMRSSTLPNQNLAFDMKTLNLHLNARVQEVLALTEAMWDWITGYQAQERARPRQYTKNGILMDAHAHMPRSARQNGDDVRVWDMIATMSRADFETRLSWFEMDMQDHIALGPVMQKTFGWRGASILDLGKSSERRAFEAACRRWDVQSQQQRRFQSDLPTNLRDGMSPAHGIMPSIGAAMSDIHDLSGFDLEDRIQFAERRDSMDTSVSSSSDYGFEINRSGRFTPTLIDDTGNSETIKKDKHRLSLYQDDVDLELLKSLSGEDSVPVEAISISENVNELSLRHSSTTITPTQDTSENPMDPSLFYKNGSQSSFDKKSGPRRRSSVSRSHSRSRTKGTGHRRKSHAHDEALPPEPEPMRLSRTYRVWAAWKPAS